MGKTTVRLALSRETIRALEPREAAEALGGLTSIEPSCNLGCTFTALCSLVKPCPG
jgi:hypothetical protein